MDHIRYRDAKSDTEDVPLAKPDKPSPSIPPVVEENIPIKPTEEVQPSSSSMGVTPVDSTLDKQFHSPSNITGTSHIVSPSVPPKTNTPSVTPTTGLRRSKRNIRPPKRLLDYQSQ